MNGPYESNQPIDSCTVFGEVDVKPIQEADAIGRGHGRVESESSRPIDGLWIIDDQDPRPAPFRTSAGETTGV